jgi:hypothetical protein
MTMEFEGYAWTSNASLVAVADRVGFALVGQMAALGLAVITVLFARRAQPSALDATALGLLTVILVGPVSWAGYTLLLLPFLFSMRWDAWTWAAILILVTPFAPGRAVASLGIDLAPFIGSSAHVSLAPVPGAALHVASALVTPLIGALYAWAVVLLLVRHVQRLAAESDIRVPAVAAVLRTRLARARGHPGQRTHSNDPVMPDVAPVRVRYDA